MVGLEGAIVICVSFAVPPPPCDALIPPQLKRNPEHMRALRTPIARAAGQSLMLDSWQLGERGEERTNRMELYRLDYSAQLSSGTSLLVVAHRRRPTCKPKPTVFRGRQLDNELKA